MVKPQSLTGRMEVTDQQMYLKKSLKNLSLKRPNVISSFSFKFLEKLRRRDKNHPYKLLMDERVVFLHPC